MTYDQLRATNVYDATQNLSDFFNLAAPRDDFQDFDTRCDRPLVISSEISQRKIMDILYKMK